MVIEGLRLVNKNCRHKNCRATSVCVHQSAPIGLVAGAEPRLVGRAGHPAVLDYGAPIRIREGVRMMIAFCVYSSGQVMI